MIGDGWAMRVAASVATAFPAVHPLEVIHMPIDFVLDLLIARVAMHGRRGEQPARDGAETIDARGRRTVRIGSMDTLRGFLSGGGRPLGRPA